MRRGVVIGVRLLLLGAAVLGVVHAVWAGHEVLWPATHLPAVVRGR